MVNIELLIFSILIVLSAVFIFKFRHRLKIETILGIPLRHPIKIGGVTIKKIPLIYAALIKTKIGIKFTDRVVEKLRNTPRYFGYLCIGIAIVGIILLLFSFGFQIFLKLTAPETIVGPAVAFVLPFKIQGAIYVPLVYWLISIFIIALVHEFGHALVSRAYNITVKNTGPAFFGILIPLIPAAYVEPDEKELKRRPKSQQLSVFSAGSAINIIVGLLALGILIFLFVPFTGKVLEYDGLEISSIYSENLEATGIEEGEIIKEIYIGERFTGEEFNDEVTGILYPIRTSEDLANTLVGLSPGTKVGIATNKRIYIHTLQPNPEAPGKSMIGAYLIQHQSFKVGAIEKYGIIKLKIVKWFHGLFVWLGILNLGIGLFNLLPMLPLDGGRMVQSTFQGAKFEKQITYGTSFLMLGLLILMFVI